MYDDQYISCVNPKSKEFYLQINFVKKLWRKINDFDKIIKMKRRPWLDFWHCAKIILLFWVHSCNKAMIDGYMGETFLDPKVVCENV